MPAQKLRQKQTPKQNRVIEMLRRQILDGSLKPQAKLPSQVEIARRFKVSSVTAHMAVARLAREGFLYSRKRHGTFVTEKPPHLNNYALVFWNDPTSPPGYQWSRYYSALTNEAIGIQQREGCRMMLFHGINQHADNDDGQRLLSYLHSKRLGGIIFANFPYHLMGNPILDEPGIPRVALVSSQAAPHVPAVWFDGEMWLDKALAYLTTQGRQRIAILMVGRYRTTDEFITDRAGRCGLTIPPYWRLVVAVQDMCAARNIVHLLMRSDATTRPDGLVICDDNIVEYSLAGLIAAGARVPDDVAVVGHCNFPWPPPQVLPVRRLGFDIGQTLRTCVDLLEKQRRGKSVPAETKLPALFEEECVPQPGRILANAVRSSPMKPASATSPTTRAMLGFAADWPLLKKVQTIDSFLGNDYFHESGIMYAMWWWKGDELRPYRDEDFAGQLPFVRPDMTAVGQMDNENSTWTSGIFLWSQCLRFMVTREPQALEFAARAFRSIDLIFKLTESTLQRGFLCKPYQWRASLESSPDQHYGVVMALWLYRDLCDKQTRERADFILVAIAKWWISNDYKLAFFGHAAASWLLANTPQYGPMFALFAHIAYRLTNDETYLRECRRVLELCGSWHLIYDDIRLRRRAGDTSYYPWPKQLHGREYDPARRPFLMSDWETRGAMSFVSGPAEYFLKTDLVNPHLLRHVIGRIYRYMQFGLRDDLLQLYWEQVDLERDLWRPIKFCCTDETMKSALFGWHFLGYFSEVCNQDSVLRFVETCLIAHQHAYEFSPGALSLAQRILAGLDAERLRTFVDPDGQQLLPPDAYLKHTLCSEIADISIAYWRARLNNIPLEQQLRQH